MRIIAGELKGRRLRRPTGRGCGRRPIGFARRCSTSWRRDIAARASSMGMPGTGAVGIEALSRGAVDVTFVEQDSRAAAAHRSEPGALRRRKTAMLLSAQGLRGHARGAVTPRSTSFFSIRRTGVPVSTSALDAAAPLTADGTLLVIEHARRDEAPAERVTLRRTRALTLGRQRAGLLHGDGSRAT